MENSQTAFQTGCTIFCTLSIPAEYKIQISPITDYTLKCSLITVFIYVFLKEIDIKHLFVCLWVIFMPSLRKHLCISFFHFNQDFSFYYGELTIYSRYKSLSDIWLAGFFRYAGYLFIFLITSFEVFIFLILMKFNVYFFSFLAYGWKS